MLEKVMLPRGRAARDTWGQEGEGGQATADLLPASRVRPRPGPSGRHPGVCTSVSWAHPDLGGTREADSGPERRHTCFRGAVTTPSPVQRCCDSLTPGKW